MKVFSIALIQILIAQISSVLMFKFIDLGIVGEYQKIYYLSSLSYSLLLFGSEQSITTRAVRNKNDDINSYVSFYLNFFIIGLFFSSLVAFLFTDFGVKQIIILFITSISLYAIKIHQTFVTIEKKLVLFYKRGIILSSLLILLYYFSMITNTNNDVVIFFVFRFAIIAVLIYYIPKDINFRLIYKSGISNYLNIINKDIYFIIFFTISNLYLFIDRILLIDVLDNASYANYVFNFSIASFFFLPKMIVANRFINESTIYDFRKKVIFKSLPISILLFFGFIIFYYPLINFLKLESNFNYLCIIYCIALIDLLLGPNGMVLQIRYDEKKLISGEIIGLLIFFLLFYFLRLKWELILVGYFLTKALLNLYRLIQIKSYDK